MDEGNQLQTEWNQGREDGKRGGGVLEDMALLLVDGVRLSLSSHVKKSVDSFGLQLHFWKKKCRGSQECHFLLA